MDKDRSDDKETRIQNNLRILAKKAKTIDINPINRIVIFAVASARDNYVPIATDLLFCNRKDYDFSVGEDVFFSEEFSLLQNESYLENMEMYIDGIFEESNLILMEGKFVTLKELGSERAGNADKAAV